MIVKYNFERKKINKEKGTYYFKKTEKRGNNGNV